MPATKLDAILIGLNLQTPNARSDRPFANFLFQKSSDNNGDRIF